MAAIKKFTIAEVEVEVYETSVVIDGVSMHYASTDFLDTLSETLRRSLWRAQRYGKREAQAAIREAIFK